MGRRTTDGIADCRVNCPIEVRAFRAERIIAHRTQFPACLPPTVLAYNNPRVKLIVQSGAYPHGSSRRLNIDPASGGNIARRCSFGVQFHFRMECALTQAGYGSMLGLAEDSWLCARQHKRKPRRQVWSCRAHKGFLKVRESRMAMLEEGLRPELYLARRGGKSTRVTLRVDIRVFGMSRTQCHSHSAWLAPELIQGHSTGTELLPIGRFNITLPEPVAKAEARC